jgi:hypothetical protein
MVCQTNGMWLTVSRLRPPLGVSIAVADTLPRLRCDNGIPDLWNGRGEPSTTSTSSQAAYYGYVLASFVSEVPAYDAAAKGIKRLPCRTSLANNP